MPYSITMIKGTPVKRIVTAEYLDKKENDIDFKNSTGTSIEKVFVSFGWADFIVIINGNNIELIKESIIRIRSDLQGLGDYIETSSIMCTTSKEIKEMKNNFFGNKKSP